MDEISGARVKHVISAQIRNARQGGKAEGDGSVRLYMTNPEAKPDDVWLSGASAKHYAISTGEEMERFELPMGMEVIASPARGGGYCLPCKGWRLLPPLQGVEELSKSKQKMEEL
jgi:hypothetical protein